MKRTEFESGNLRLVATICGSDPEILLLHAGGERRHVWRPIQERLARSGFASIAFDQRGHGESGGSVEDGFGSFARGATDMLEAFPTIRLVVGASLGGLSLLLACSPCRVQERLAGFVMVDVVPTPNPDRVKAFLIRQSDHLGRSPLIESIFSYSSQLTEAAKALTLPVLLVRAGQSSPMSNEEVRVFRSQTPQLDIAHIDQASHLVARDAPLALADQILIFEQNNRVRGSRREQT